jgi:hypothetical protein
LRTVFFILLIISFRVNAQDFYSGENKSHKFIFARINDSIATVEICHKFTYLDTLRFSDGIYRSKQSKIIRKDDRLIYQPGNIILSKNLIDTGYYRTRIFGYYNNKSNLMFGQLSWIGSKNSLAIRLLFNDKNIDHYIPDFYYRNLDFHYRAFMDSICFHYSERFNKVTIGNNRLLFRKEFMDSRDTIVIEDVWMTLFQNQLMFKKISNLYLFQWIPVFILTVVSMPYEYVLYVPVSMTVNYMLIELEKAVWNRFTSGKTYVIKFYSENKVLLKARVHNNYIVNDRFYKYKLANDFSKFLQ